MLRVKIAALVHKNLTVFMFVDDRKGVASVEGGLEGGHTVTPGRAEDGGSGTSTSREVSNMAHFIELNPYLYRAATITHVEGWTEDEIKEVAFRTLVQGVTDLDTFEVLSDADLLTGVNGKNYGALQGEAVPDSVKDLEGNSVDESIFNLQCEWNQMGARIMSKINVLTLRFYEKWHSILPRTAKPILPSGAVLKTLSVFRKMAREAAPWMSTRCFKIQWALRNIKGFFEEIASINLIVEQLKDSADATAGGAPPVYLNEDSVLHGLGVAKLEAMTEEFELTLIPALNEARERMKLELVSAQASVARFAADAVVASAVTTYASSWPHFMRQEYVEVIRKLCQRDGMTVSEAECGSMLGSLTDTCQARDWCFGAVEGALPRVSALIDVAASILLSPAMFMLVIDDGQKVCDWMTREWKGRGGTRGGKKGPVFF